jgi:hypothetical protein
MVVASAGSLEALGHGEFLYLGEIAGIAIIFAGFLRSREQLRIPLPHRPWDGGQASQPAPAPAGGGEPVRSIRRIRDRTTAARR